MAKAIRTNDGKKGGLLNGKPHYDKDGNSLGGIKAVVVDTGQPVELEGGEIIINKAASKKHWKKLSKINQSAGNGVPILPPDGADMGNTEEYKDGGRIIQFNPNNLPYPWMISYARKIKENYPEIWSLGGNEYGNEAFENLERVSKRGKWLDKEEWFYVKWQSFNARHEGDFLIAGVIANLKWANKVEKGWKYMKDLIEKEIKSVKSKRKADKKSGKKTVPVLDMNMFKDGGTTSDLKIVLHNKTTSVYDTAAQKLILEYLKNRTKASYIGFNKFLEKSKQASDDYNAVFYVNPNYHVEGSPKYIYSKIVYQKNAADAYQNALNYDDANPAFIRIYRSGNVLGYSAVPEFDIFADWDGDKYDETGRLKKELKQKAIENLEAALYIGAEEKFEPVAEPKIENVGVTPIEGGRYSFKNDFGSFTSILVYIPGKDAKEFMVQVMVRRKNTDGTETIQKKEQWMPLDRYEAFITDLKARQKASEEAGEKMENGGSTSFDKVISASTRFKPSETVVFDPPLEGKNGSKLTSYTWSYEWTMQHSQRDGELVSKRVSDWSQAEISADTGRDIVHQYTVLMPDGEVRTVSSDSVPVLLGYIDRKEMKSFPNLVTASKTLAKQQMQLAILEAQEKEYNELNEKYTKQEKPEIKEIDEPVKFIGVQESYAKGAHSVFAMGDVWERQDNEPIYGTQEYKKRSISKTTTEQLVSAWIRKRIEEDGGKYPRGLYDLKKRVERQKRKVENILSSKMEEGGNIPEEPTEALSFDQKKITARNWWSQTLSSNEQKKLLIDYAPEYSLDFIKTYPTSAYSHLSQGIYRKGNDTILNIWEGEGAPRWSDFTDKMYGHGDLTDPELSTKLYYAVQAKQNTQNTETHLPDMETTNENEIIETNDQPTDSFDSPKANTHITELFPKSTALPEFTSQERYSSIRECLLSDGDNDNDFIFEGKKVYDLKSEDTWEIVEFKKDTIVLKHVPKSPLAIEFTNLKELSFSQVRQAFADEKIGFEGVNNGNTQLLNSCLKAIQQCMDKIDLIEYKKTVESHVIQLNNELAESARELENRVSSMESLEVPSLEVFAEVVRDSKDFEEAFSRVRKMKGVSNETSTYFFNKYNPTENLSMEEAFRAFYDEIKGGDEPVPASEETDQNALSLEMEGLRDAEESILYLIENQASDSSEVTQWQEALDLTRRKIEELEGKIVGFEEYKHAVVESPKGHKVHLSITHYPLNAKLKYRLFINSSPDQTFAEKTDADETFAKLIESYQIKGYKLEDVKFEKGGEVKSNVNAWLAERNAAYIKELKESRDKFKAEAPEDFVETEGGSGRNKQQILADYDEYIAEHEAKKFATGGNIDIHHSEAQEKIDEKIMQAQFGKTTDINS